MYMRNRSMPPFWSDPGGGLRITENFFAVQRHWFCSTPWKPLVNWLAVVGSAMLSILARPDSFGLQPVVSARAKTAATAERRIKTISLTTILYSPKRLRLQLSNYRIPARFRYPSAARTLVH